MTVFDENKAVLADIMEQGADLTVERGVDFSHIFERGSDTTDFIRSCAELGHDAEDTTSDEMQHCDITVSISMMPTCHNITKAEDQLGKLATRHNGRTDGWGFWSD